MANSNYDIITLKAADGEEIEFKEIAEVKLGTKTYAVLQPVELLPGMSDDEVLVFLVTRMGSDNKYDIVTDDGIVDKVLKKCNQMVAGSSGNKKVKKSGGANKVFGATTKVVKKTFWLIKLIIAIVLAIGGISIGFAGIFTQDGIFLKIVYVAVGIGFVACAVSWIRKLWKNRK